MSQLSEDQIDKLVVKMANGSKKNKEKKSSDPLSHSSDENKYNSNLNSKHNKSIKHEEVNFDNLDTKTKKVYGDLFSGMVDLYKILGADPSDSHEIIKKKYTERMAKYHPDKIGTILVKVPKEKRDEEKKKLAIQYKLIRDAYSTLRNPEKRKYYDLQRQTDKSRDFLKQKDSFKEFVELQESEMNEKTKELSHTNFKMGMIELDNKHGFDRQLYDEQPMTKHDASRKYNDLMMEREQSEIEYTPKDLFGGNTKPSAMEFNKEWEKMKKREEKKKNKNKDCDGSIVAWEGVGAFNDVGLGGATDFVSIDNYEDLYVDKNFDTTEFATRMDSDVEMDSAFESDNDSDIDVSYVTGHNKNKEDIMRKFANMESRRKVEEDEYEKRELHNEKSWKTVMDNPMNISASMGTILGRNDFTKIDGPKKKKQIGTDLADAYKQLIYERDDK